MEPSNRKRMADVAESRTDEKPEELPPVTTLEINAETPKGKIYKGTFTYHVPRLGDRVDITRLHSEYMSELKAVDAAEDGASIAQMLAYLHVTIERKESDPAWWRDSKRGIDLYDYAPILALYAAARAYEATFLGASTNTRESTEESRDNSGVSDSGSVERNVQSPPKRRTLVEIDGKGGVRAGTSTSDHAADENGANQEGH